MGGSLMSDVRRREFITLLGGAAAAWPLVARAQQPAMPVIGFLNGASAWEYAHLAAAFRQGLSDTGYIEGRNLLVEYRWAEGHYDRLPMMAADLVRRQVAVIAANSPATVAARAATRTIPIVFATTGDPVKLGFVASLNRPGGNLTGATSLAVEVGPKRLELVRELVPTATVIALLVNPAGPNAETQSTAMQAAAANLGLRLDILRANSERDFDTVFAKLVQLRAAALVIAADPLFTSQSEQLAALALRHSVPAIYLDREFVAAGGLMSYSASTVGVYHQVGVYTGRILKGERPADLPVVQATKIELVINLKTARMLGLTVPDKLLALADEVIE
jgi:putative tryptophan/tyrosine transport system substrate-binding protein